MSNRFGFWTLLIASTLWTQGCTHTSHPFSDSTPHKLLGAWECSVTTQTGNQLTTISIDTRSTLYFSETQMISEGISTLELTPKTSNSVSQVTLRHKYIANYQLLDKEAPPKIVFYVVEHNVTEISTSSTVKSAKFLYNPKQRNQSTIVKLTDNELTLQTIEPYQKDISKTQVQCNRLTQKNL